MSNARVHELASHASASPCVLYHHPHLLDQHFHQHSSLSLERSPKGMHSPTAEPRRQRLRARTLTICSCLPRVPGSCRLSSTPASARRPSSLTRERDTQFGSAASTCAHLQTEIDAVAPREKCTSRPSRLNRAQRPLRPVLHESPQPTRALPLESVRTPPAHSYLSTRPGLPQSSMDRSRLFFRPRR